MCIRDRTKAKADIIADQFRINSLNFPQASKYDFDIIINTTPVYPEILTKLLLRENTVLFDADYKACPMKEFAGKFNARYINGIEWLAEQGRASYMLMTGKMNSSFSVNISQLQNSVKNQKRIALIGMMGTGKSTIGKKIAEKLNYSFIDMDEMLSLIHI